jgi:hypothetical protein
MSRTPVPDQPQTVKVEKPFAAAGSIEMQLETGDYVVRAAPDERIRVSFGGNTGNAVAELANNGTHANLAIRDTPHNNFRVTIEVPQVADLAVHLTGGNLQIAAITGNKEIDSKAGNVEIWIPNPNDYGSVDAAVKVGNLNGGPFGASGSGLSPHLQMVGIREVRIACQSGGRQPGAEALEQFACAGLAVLGILRSQTFYHLDDPSRQRQ